MRWKQAGRSEGERADSKARPFPCRRKRRLPLGAVAMAASVWSGLARADDAPSPQGDAVDVTVRPPTALPTSAPGDPTVAGTPLVALDCRGDERDHRLRV